MSTTPTVEIPATHRDLVDQPTYAVFTTLTPAGVPHSSVVWHRYEDGLLKLTVTTDRQKYKNVSANPNVNLTVVDPAGPFRYLEVRGVVDSIEPDPDYTFRNGLSERYLGNPEYPFATGPEDRVVIAVRPTKVVAFG